jgi:hypothetical protein
VVKNPLAFGVGGVVELKTTVETEPLNDVRSHPATHIVTRVQNARCHAVSSEVCGGRESGKAGTHDHNIFRSGQLHA